MARQVQGRGQSATAHALTVSQVRERLQVADARELAALERILASDTRKGVLQALETARRRIQAEEAEAARLAGMYEYQNELAQQHGGGIIVGLDEVGRGPLAGPLAVGAVVLPDEPRIPGLNDSKQLSPEERERIAAQVKEQALAWAVVYVEPADIDAYKMTACLIRAFSKAIAQMEAGGIVPDVVLLDGNPLRMDPREVNVIKGDGKCASIAAASIIAKVERDALMCRLAEQYPEYGFDSCKGYASAAHIAAIKEHGLSPVHRVSFCQSFIEPEQPTLF